MTDLELKPRLRFKGFTEAWEQRKLGDIGYCKSGVGFPDCEQGGTFGIPFFKVSDMNSVGNEKKLKISNNYVSSSQIQAHGWKLFPAPAIFFAKVGAAVLLNRKRLIFTGFLLDNNTMAFSIDINNTDVNFMFSTFERINLPSLVQIGALPSYNANQVEDISVFIPSNIEQKKIGQLFDQLDSLITLHQRKLIFLKSHRFRMSVLFCYSWEQRKVKEIAERYDNLRIPVAASQRESGSIPYYGANGIQDYVNGFTHNGEFVLVAEDGANDLKNYPVQYVNGKIWVNNHAHVLQSNKNNNTMFLKYLIGSTDIESLLVGGGRAKLNAEVLMSIDLTLPNKVEQKQIAIFFDRLDSLITLHQRKQL